MVTDEGEQLGYRWNSLVLLGLLLPQSLQLDREVEVENRSEEGIQVVVA